MRFSSNRAEGPRRRPSHATVVAYVALIVAVMGSTAATAATLVRTRDIANGAVTNPKIRNDAVGNHKLRGAAVGTQKIRDGAVTNPKIRDGAVTDPKIRSGTITGNKVANNTLTGRNIDESTLQVTRIAHQVSGSETVSSVRAWTDYPLTVGNPYTQPAHTAELYFGTFRVRFPADCTGWRSAAMELIVNNRFVGWGQISDQSDGEVTEDAVISPSYWHDGNHLFVGATDVQRQLRAQIYGSCNGAPTVGPEVLSATIHVVRYR